MSEKISWFMIFFLLLFAFGLGFSFALSFGQVNLVSYMRTRVLIENFDQQKFRVSASSSVVQTKELLLIVSNIKRCLKILQIYNLMFPGSQRDKASTCSVGSVGSTEYRCYRPYTSLREGNVFSHVCLLFCMFAGEWPPPWLPARPDRDHPSLVPALPGPVHLGTHHVLDFFPSGWSAFD